MLDETLQNYSGLTVLTVLFLVAGSLLVASNRMVMRKARYAFVVCMVLAMVLTIADWFNNVYNGVPGHRLEHIVSTAFIFSVAPMLPVAIANIILPSRSAKWVLGILAVHCVVEIASVFTGIVFSVDETNVYRRGPLYFVYTAMYAFSAIYLVVESIRSSHVYQARNPFVVIAVLLCLATGVGIQVANGNVRISWLAVSMSLVLYFLYYCDMVTRIDPLTKLLNRRSYNDALEISRSVCSVAVIDIDDFKNINDTYGHSYGDECLSAVATCIRHTYGSSGLCYRTGGDEFVVIMPKFNGDREALDNRLEQFLAHARNRDERIPTVSIGWGQAGGSNSGVTEAVEMADKAMYENKRKKGVNR